MGGFEELGKKLDKLAEGIKATTQSKTEKAAKNGERSLMNWERESRKRF